MNFPLRSTRGSNDGEFLDDCGVMKVRKVFEGKTEGGDEGFRCIGGFGMEDFKGEGGIWKRERERESETFVPNGGGVTRIVGFGGETTVRIEPEDDVGFEIAGFPVDVFEVFGGDDCEVEIDGF